MGIWLGRLEGRALRVWKIGARSFCSAGEGLGSEGGALTPQGRE